MDRLPGILAAALLAVSCYTDLRWRLIRNWAVGGAAAGGLILGAALHGLPGLLTGLEGIAVGATWWVAVRYAGLGAGDAKLAMAIGAILVSESRRVARGGTDRSWLGLTVLALIIVAALVVKYSLAGS